VAFLASLQHVAQDVPRSGRLAAWVSGPIDARTASPAGFGDQLRAGSTALIDRAWHWRMAGLVNKGRLGQQRCVVSGAGANRNWALLDSGRGSSQRVDQAPA